MPVPGTTLTSLRPLIQGTNGVVVSSHPAAAMAGLEILRRGGNAIDAGVAVGLALNVVRPRVQFPRRSTDHHVSSRPP